MASNLTAEQSIALGLLQATLVALSLWLGITRYAFTNLTDEVDNEFNMIATIAGGFLILGFAIDNLSSYLESTISSNRIVDSLLAIDIFLILIATNVVYMSLKLSEDHEHNVKDFIKALSGGLVLFSVMAFAGHLI